MRGLLRVVPTDLQESKISNLCHNGIHGTYCIVGKVGGEEGGVSVENVCQKLLN